MFNFDKQFFEKNQKRLLKIANSKWLRWILGLNRLPKRIKELKIDKITPNSVHSQNTGYFFTRPRFAEALAYNLSPFCYFQELRSPKFSWRFSPAGLAYVLLFGLLGKFAGLPLAFMATTTNYYPVVGDAAPGRWDLGNVWATEHDAATAGQLDAGANPYLLVRYFNSGGGLKYTISRNFSNYDTSGISDTATVTGVTSYVYWNGANADDSRSYNVYGSTAQDTIAVEDWDLGGTTAYSDTAVTQASYVSAGYKSWVWNATGIAAVSLTGITKICYRDVTKDVANVAPVSENNCFITFYTSAQTGTAEDPYLSVTYAAVPAFLFNLVT